jgi:hypothetical protein
MLATAGKDAGAAESAAKHEAATIAANIVASRQVLEPFTSFLPGGA